MGLSVIWLVVIAVIVGLFVAPGLNAVLVAAAVLVGMVIGTAVYNIFINGRVMSSASEPQADSDLIRATERERCIHW